MRKIEIKNISFNIIICLKTNEKTILKQATNRQTITLLKSLNHIPTLLQKCLDFSRIICPRFLERLMNRLCARYALIALHFQTIFRYYFAAIYFIVYVNQKCFKVVRRVRCALIRCSDWKLNN
jgi:hypothetical protein